MSEPQVIFGAGHVHVTQVKDAKGNKIDPPTPIAIPAVQNISADLGKADIKTMHGQKEFPIHVAQGKKTTAVSFECGELFAQFLNSAFFGQSVSSGSNIIYRDTTGRVLPSNYKTNAKIQNVVAVHLGRWIANTSVTIKTGSTVNNATKITDAFVVLKTTQYRVSASGVYEFASADKGKEVAITYKVMDKTTQSGSTNGTAVVSTFKIPAKLEWQARIFSRGDSITEVAGLVKKPYDPTTTPAANQYQFANNGILIFNSAQATDSLAAGYVNHVTHGVAVKTKIAALPAAGYVTIIDPPGAALFQTDQGVVLKSGTIGSLAVGAPLVKQAVPTTGKYDVDTGGIYTFADADADAVVTISYYSDFLYSWTTVPDAEGEFLTDKGVRNVEGMPLTRVKLTSPLSLLPNQYAVDAGGTYYFDTAQFGDTLYVDYEYSSTQGVTLAIENNDMGSSPTVELDLSGIAEGQEWRLNYKKAIPKSVTFATKMDDFSMYKCEFEVMADRVSNKVGTIYLTS